LYYTETSRMVIKACLNILYLYWGLLKFDFIESSYNKTN